MMKNKRYQTTLATAAFSLLLCGCGLYKPYMRPAAIASQLEETDTTTLRWREVFSNPALQTLIDSVLVHNTDLRVSQLRIGEAEEQLRTARLSLLPSVNLSADASTADFSTFATSLAGRAQWQIDVFAGLTNATRKAKAALMESEDYSRAVRTQLVADVAGLWYSLALLRQQREVTAENVALWAETIDKTTAMKEAGMVTDAALAQYEATYWQAKSSLTDYDYNIKLVENSLGRLLGDSQSLDDYGTLLAQSTALGGEQQEFGSESLAAMKQLDLSKMAHRPDVRMAEEQLMQAYYGTAIARASLYPSLTLSGNGLTDLNFNSVATQVAASVAQPVFNSGANRARLRVAQLQQEEALMNFKQTLCDAALELDDVYGKLRTATEKSHSLAQQVVSLERAAQSTNYLMEYGTAGTTYLDVLTARRSLLSAQLAELSNHYDELSAIISLYKAWGGDR